MPAILLEGTFSSGYDYSLGRCCGGFMRERIAEIIQIGSFVLALLAAVFWMYFIWSFDWGHFGGRSWGLWFFFAFLIGALLVGLAVILVLFWISSLVDPD